MKNTTVPQTGLMEMPVILTPGPVMMEPEILALGGAQTPYFRNDDFSRIHQNCERLLLEAVKAPEGSRAVFIAGSGTAAMEAAVLNFTQHDKPVLIVQGGTFGQRFVDIAAVHHRTVQLVPGDRIPKPLSNSGITAKNCEASALLINAHETSTGHLYDLNDSAEYCRRGNALHIVDAISSFGADEINMKTQSIDVLILSSNKAMGLQPGLSMLVMTPRAIERIPLQVESFYFNVATMLKDGKRGQTPFTPAVNILMQLQYRLTSWVQDGMTSVVKRTGQTADYFRQVIENLPLRIFAHNPSNALTALELPSSFSAKRVVNLLEKEYGIVVAANGGLLCESVFRVSHLGNVGCEEMDLVASALSEILLEKFE